MNTRNACLLLFAILAFLMAYTPLRALLETTNQREYYSHIVMIPFVSAYFLYQKRKALFAMREPVDPSIATSPRADRIVGISLLSIGALFYYLGHRMEAGLAQNDFASIIALSSVLIINGGFMLSYGIKAFKLALFPLLFLLFVVPLPLILINSLISFLQSGSTEFTNLLFLTSGVPFFREGFFFHLPEMSIEVAKQCSGIRSGLALFITALLAGHLFLKSWHRKVILLLSIFPITMFKNAVRIVTLTLLGNYVDPRILTSELHREGGIPFFLVALLMLAPVLYVLRRSEKKKKMSG